MSGELDQRALLASARADLLEGQELARTGVPDHVAASWRRSLAQGVSPTSVQSRYVTELDFGARLVRCAQPVIDQLSEQLADAPVCVALTDAKARIVVRKDSGQWISRLLDQVYFAQGFDYAEGAVGTNGVGTVLEFGASVQIVGAEHFVDALQPFACAGAPVRNPFTGRIEGVLDISCLSEHFSPIMHSLVRSAAKRVERNLLLDRSQAQQALFDVFSRVDARTREAVLAVGPRMVMVNTAMQTLLDATDQAALGDHMRFLTGRRPGRVDDRVALPSGVSVRLRGSMTEVGDASAGMVGVVTLCGDLAVTDPPTPVTSPVSTSARRWQTDAAPVTRASSPAWSAAAASVEKAMRAGRTILVLGETGSGRLTLLSDMYARHGPGDRVVTLDANEANGAAKACAATLAGEVQAPTLLVLRDLDRVTGSAGVALLETLGNHTSGLLHIAATASPTGTLPHQPLLAIFDESTSLPPLRNRSVDLPGLARVILDDLDPHHRVRLSEEVLRLLSRYSWPGNVEELREVLISILTRRPVGTIEPHDLPAYCQSTPRGNLREVDKVERDAIVSALRAEGGNRKAAATALGIARSTLYRKIRQYGITD